jgi:hypothetical protein
VAARNSEQTAEEASAPVPQTIIPNESLSSDVASYSSGLGSSGLGDTSSSLSGPGGVHVINRSELSELNMNSEDQVVHEPGPSITVNGPSIRDETVDAEEANGSPSFKEKVKSPKKLSQNEKEVIKYSGVGTINLLAMGIVGYWGWKKYNSGENGWKVLGIVAGCWVGISALEFAGMRYSLHTSMESNG